MSEETAGQVASDYLQEKYNGVAASAAKVEQTQSGYRVDAAVAIISEGRPRIEVHQVFLDKELNPIKSKLIQKANLNPQTV